MTERRALNTYNLVFTDSETTELDPEIGEIISLATKVMTPQGELVAKGEWHMHPRWPERAHPKALEVNGYTKAAWDARGVVSHEAALTEYLEMAREGIFVAQNVAFDWSFLLKEMSRHPDLKWVGDYHRLDTASMLWPVYMSGDTGMTGISLSKACEHFGVTNEGAHDAMTDVDRMVEVYQHVVGWI